MRYTKEMIKEDADVIKAVKFKTYFWELVENGEYEKAKQFREYFYHYFERKGKKSEYVYIMERSCESICNVTDDMSDKYEYPP